MTQTPGPWTHKAYDTSSTYETQDEVIGANGHVVCCNTPYYPTGVKRDDARLIAAAPDLLAALEEAIAWDAYDDEDVPAVWLNQARAAIAKAKGGDA